MLFDLRSRGRRRTVQAVYLGLALLMLFGLVLFGVGTGTGGGGLLNAFGGGSSNQKAVVSQQEKAALRATRLTPNSPTAWGQLVEARWTSAGQGNNINATTGAFTAAGRKELASLTQAWQKYQTLAKTADPNVAILAARAYGQLGNYAEEANAWEAQTQGQPNAAKGYMCLAAAAYAAKQTRKGDLAAQKTLSLIPKASQAAVKLQLQGAKTSPSLAQSC